jgi:hypothetical protein
LIVDPTRTGAEDGLTGYFDVSAAPIYLNHTGKATLIASYPAETSGGNAVPVHTRNELKINTTSAIWFTNINDSWTFKPGLYMGAKTNTTGMVMEFVLGWDGYNNGASNGRTHFAIDVVSG